MKLVTAEEMRDLEKRADAAGLSYDEMMECAGRAVALAIEERARGGKARILVLVGPGNNGGDALVAARYLHRWGHEVTVYVWKRAIENDPNLRRAQAYGLQMAGAHQDRGFNHLVALVGKCQVLVDGLLGTGATGPLRGDLPDLLRRVRGALSCDEARTPLSRVSGQAPRPARRGRPLIVAIDLPSGLHSDTGEIDPLALSADLTVTFAYPKRGLFSLPGASFVGKLFVADIGIDPAHAKNVALELATENQIASMLPDRPVDAHKGTFGRALIVAGSANYVGAPCLAASAAYRGGAGLVTLAVAESIYPIVAAKLLEPTYLVLPDDLGALVPGAVPVLATRLGSYDAMLLGPGLGTEEPTREFVEELISGRGRGGRKRVGFDVQNVPDSKPWKLPPLVLDADALNLLAMGGEWWKRIPEGTVLTPHPGEMARLLGCDASEVNADRIGAARSGADSWRCTVVLKGAYSVIATPQGKTTVIPFANPALATAGTGDVLAGLIVGLMAQGLSPTGAAVCGAFLHGMAGELGRERYGNAGMLAGDLLTLLPETLRVLMPPSRSQAHW